MDWNAFIMKLVRTQDLFRADLCVYQYQCHLVLERGVITKVKYKLKQYKWKVERIWRDQDDETDDDDDNNDNIDNDDKKHAGYTQRYKQL